MPQRPVTTDRFPDADDNSEPYNDIFIIVSN